MGQVLSVHLEPLTNQHLEPNHVFPILSCFLFTLSAYPIFPKKVLSVSRCHYIYIHIHIMIIEEIAVKLSWGLLF